MALVSNLCVSSALVVLRDWSRRDRRLMEHWPRYSAPVCSWLAGPGRRSGVQFVNLAIVYHNLTVGRISLSNDVFPLVRLGMVIRPDYCGRGIGSAALGLLLASVAAPGWCLSAHEDNVPALRLYQRFGFVEVARAGVFLRMRRAASVGVPLPFLAPVCQ